MKQTLRLLLAAVLAVGPLVPAWAAPAPAPAASAAKPAPASASLVPGVPPPAPKPAVAPKAWLPKTPTPLERPMSEDGLEATIYRLPNGLTIYMSPNHEKPRIAAWIAVRTGSKNDPPTTTGLAHYLEHMLFKGTTRLGTLDYAKEKPHLDRIVELYEKHFHAKDPAERARLYKEIDKENIAASKYEVPNELDKVYHRLGFTNLNAFTSDEETVFVVDMPKNRLDVWARLESQRFQQPVFRLFQSELEAVYEEKNRSLDNAERILGEAMNKALYPEHPYGTQTTIGTIHDLKNPSLARMYKYFHEHYEPNNMAIALAGDFEPQQALAIIRRDFGSWKPGPPPPKKTWPLPKPKGRKFIEVKYEAEEKVQISWLTVPYLDPDADALTVMDMIMDNSAAGLLNLRLNQAQLVKESGSYPDFNNDAGDWTIWAVPKRGQTLEQAEALLMQTVAALKRGDFTDDDIKAVITAFEISEKARLESNWARVGTMADSFVHEEQWEHSVHRLDRLRAVTRADVVRVANKYLTDDRVVGYRRYGKPVIPSITKPGFTKIDIDDSRESKFAADLLAMPAEPIEPRWLVEGRDYWTAQLHAGKLYVSKNPFNDLFDLNLVFERGSRQEPDLCAALALLDLSGAGKLTADEYKKKLFAMGTSIGYGCGERESSVSISGLESNLWPSLELMQERFEAPNIATGTLKKFVDVTIGAHQDTKKDPNAVAGALGEYARRGKDSSVLHELSDKELLALKTADLRKIIEHVLDYKHRFAYVGTRQLGEISRLLDEDKRFKSPPEAAPLRYIRRDKPAVYFTNREMVQAHVGVFSPDEILDPSHILDYAVYSTYMGGGMSSVIFQEVREARSLAYASWGGYSYGARKGDQNEVFGGLGCQADKTVEAATLLRSLLEKPPLTPERFAETQKALDESYRADPIGFRAIPSAVMSWEDEGIVGGDPRPARFARLQTYTLGDLSRFSARFAKEPMTIYVLGDRSRVGLDGLRKLGDFSELKLDDLFPY